MKQPNILAIILAFASFSYCEMNVKNYQESINTAKAYLESKNDSGKVILQTVINENLELIKHDELKFAAAYAIGRAAFYLGDDPLSEKYLTIAIDANQDSASPLYLRGILFRFKGDKRRSIMDIKEACRRNGYSFRYWNDLSLAYAINLEWSNAIKSMNSALKIDSSSPQAHYMLATYYMELKDNKQAIISFRKAQHIDPNFKNLNYNIGQLYQTDLQHDSALKYFKIAASSDSNDWRAKIKVIQELNAINDSIEAQTNVKDLYRMRSSKRILGLDSTSLFVREQFILGDLKIYGIEYFELTGNEKLKFAFNATDKNGNRKSCRIALSVNSGTDEISKELGTIGKNDTLYALDAYTLGKQELLGFFKNEPDYNVISKIVRKEMPRVCNE